MEAKTGAEDIVSHKAMSIAVEGDVKTFDGERVFGRIDVSSLAPMA